jgi:hypothetical protein
LKLRDLLPLTMKTMLTVQEVSSYLEKEDFVLITQCQIAKDFRSIGYEFPSEFEVNPMELTQIIYHLQIAIKEVFDSHNLSQLFYQIDMPESTSISILNEPDCILQLSNLVLRREAYKVYLRSLF